MSTAPASNEVLINPASRMQRTTVYQRSDGTKFWGIYVPITFEARDDDTYYIMTDPNKGMRMDQVAQQVYGDVNLWWVIMEANGIINPFEELTAQGSPAQSNIVYSSNNLACFQAVSKNNGTRYNSANVQGITFETTNTSLAVMINGNIVETFANLSPYPNNLDGTPNPYFWGSINSAYITINWLSPYTLQESIGGTVPAPMPPNEGLYNMYGGTDDARVILRIPSLSNVHEQLST